jgi:hypothetical protein
MHYVTFALFVLSVILFVVSLVWALSERGKTVTRVGAEIGEELMSDKLDVESRRQGRQSLWRRTGFRGKGWAVERTAEYSYAEIARMLREGRTTEALPALLGMVAVLGAAIFGGLSLLLWPAAHIIVRALGALFLAWAVYAGYLIAQGFRER